MPPCPGHSNQKPPPPLLKAIEGGGRNCPFRNDTRMDCLENRDASSDAASQTAALIS